MNVREINLLNTRIKTLKNFIARQMGMKKAERNQRDLKAAYASITTIRSWINDSAPKPRPEKAAPISKAEFDLLIKGILGDSKDPKAYIKIDTKAEVDRLWEGLKTANIQVACPPEVDKYIRKKMKKERLYSLIPKRK